MISGQGQEYKGLFHRELYHQRLEQLRREDSNVATNAELKQRAIYAGIFIFGALVGAWLG